MEEKDIVVFSYDALSAPLYQLFSVKFWMFVADHLVYVAGSLLSGCLCHQRDWNQQWILSQPKRSLVCPGRAHQFKTSRLPTSHHLPFPSLLLEPPLQTQQSPHHPCDRSYQQYFNTTTSSRPLLPPLSFRNCFYFLRSFFPAYLVPIKRVFPSPFPRSISTFFGVGVRRCFGLPLVCLLLPSSSTPTHPSEVPFSPSSSFQYVPHSISDYSTVFEFQPTPFQNHLCSIFLPSTVSPTLPP